MNVPLDASPYNPETYVPRYPANELDAAKYSPLTARPISPVAVSACKSLLAHVFKESGDHTTGKQFKALGALIADLLERRPDDQGGWHYRSMDAASFTGGSVGYRPFVKVYSALTELMIEEVRGNRVWVKSELTNNTKQPSWQRATRFRATPSLRLWFVDQGISVSNWSDHFERDPSPPMANKATCSVILREGKPPRHFGVSRGYKIPIVLSDPKVASLVARMDRINDYLSKVDVSPHGPVVLRRIFAQGDNPTHGWQEGGRLYAVGASPYQTVKRAKRADITINGEPTCELDIQASHLTILAGLGHVPRSNGDPYAIEGLPRPVVKQWVHMTLSHGRRHARWPQATLSDLMKDYDIDLKADYPLASTGDTILQHFPILKDDGSSSAAIGWGELQFRESEVIMKAIEVLAFDHDVPALPVHDSLIVPRQHEDLAKSVLGRAFRDAIGIDAVIG